jgi:hypothetical protein
MTDRTFPVNCELPHTGALKNMGGLFRPNSTRRRGNANAHRDRYRRRGRDWPDLVGRSEAWAERLTIQRQNAPMFLQFAFSGFLPHTAG